MKMLICLLLVAVQANAALPAKQVNKLADAIYVVEGGDKTHYPYGIRSINTRGNKTKARNICIRTIQNAHNKWLLLNKPIAFLDYLANKYCPLESDPIGNINWKNNIRRYVGEI